MAQIFTGAGLGLRGSSQAQLGSYGPKGVASLGQGGSSLYINAANGNVVLKQSDGFLADFGTSFDLSQTYNSREQRAWRFNTDTRLAFEGRANTTGSVVTRTDEDGHNSRFIYDAQQHAYLAEDGSTARLTFDNTSWNYREGTGQTTCHYNATGQLTRITDNDGHVLRFSYQNGQLITITDNHDKQTITWSYRQGLLQDVTFQSAGETVHHLHYDYDTHNRLSRISRDLGHGQTYWIAYDYAGDSTLISDLRQSDGTTIHLDYDAEGRIKRLIDGEGRTTNYQYLAGKTIITNGAGESWSYFYDTQSRLTGIDGPENLHIRYHYSGLHLASITQGNQRWQFVYNEAGDCVRVELPTGEVVLRTYDSEHRLLSETRYQTFDDNHQPTKPLTSHYMYDVLGHLRFEITADGTVTEHRYDANGCRINSRCYLKARWNNERDVITINELATWAASQSQQAISLVDYRYDFRGCLQEEIHYTQIDTYGEGILTADAITTYSRYDAVGRLIEKSTLLNGALSTTHYMYDDLGRLIQTMDNQQHAQTFEYDDAHQRIIKTEANGLKTISIYDKSGLLLSSHQLDATHDYGTTSYQYDAAGRLIAETNVAGKTRHMFYDAQGRLQATISITGHVTEYGYDSEGRCIQTHQYQQVTNNQSAPRTGLTFAAIKPTATTQDRISQMIYNQYNQLAYQVNAEGGVVAYTYDAQGQLITKTAYANRLENYQSNRQLTAMDMVLTAHNDDRTITYYYDAAGRLQAEVNGEGAATAYRYDAQGHLIETCRYAKKIILRTRDWNPPLLDGEDIINYSFYNAAGLKTADIDGEGYLTEYIYDSRALLTHTIAYYKDVYLPFDVDNKTLDDIRPKAHANDHHTTYRYDDLNQLIEEKKQCGLVITYGYDQQGRITSKVSTDSKTHEARGQQYRYDALGRVVQHLDALGAAKLAQNNALSESDIEAIWQQHSVRFAYDIAGNMISKTNALNETSRYIYNDAGLLAYSISASGAVTETRYNAFQQVETTVCYSAYYTGPNDTTFEQLQQHMDTIKDIQFDEITHYEYNSIGLLLRQRQGSGAEKITTYNAFGELAQLSQCTRKIITDYQYDRRGLLQNRNEDVGGINKTFDIQYDVFGRVKKQWDGRQNVIIYAWNKRGEQSVIKNPGQSQKIITYDAFGRVLSFQDKTNLFYRYNDTNHTLTLQRMGIGAVIETQFNAFGDKLSITDGNKQTSTYQYDAMGQLVHIDTPEQTTTHFEYDAAGRLTLQEDAGGHIRRFTYDAEGHVLTQIIDPDGLAITTSYTYDAIGRQLSVIDAGRCTTFSYDNQGNLLQTCQDPNGLNVITTFSYNDLGQLIRETRTNPQGVDIVTAYTRDALGRCLTSTLDPDGLQLTTTYTYDNTDNITSQTDANNHTTRYLYDANNRLRYHIDARGVVTEHRYDRVGNEINRIIYAQRVKTTAYSDEAALMASLQADPDDHYLFFSFDTQGRLFQSFDSLGHATHYSYDANDNVIVKTVYETPCSLSELKAGRARLPRVGQERTTYFVFDGLNRQRFQIDPNKQITESRYDAAGQLIQQIHFANSNLGITIQEYSLAIIESELKRDPQNDQSVYYTYDKAGRISTHASASGVITGYRYDAAGNQLECHQYATRLTATQLADADWTRFIQTSSDDRITRAIYDAAGRACYRITSSGHVIELQYDAVGNVIAEIAHGSSDHTHLTQYQYDVAGRLLSQTDAAQRTTRYQYDKNNNVISKIDANNAIWRYRYNDTNQLVETIAPATSFRTYTNGVWHEETRSVITQNKYDSFGNLSEIIKDAGGLNQTIQYTYDANNRKLQTIYPDVAVNNAGQTASRERQESIQVLSETIVYNAYGEIIETRDRAGHARHFAYNTSGRQEYMLDAEGGVTHYKYDAFDNVITKTSYITHIHPSDFTVDEIHKALINDKQDRHEYYLYDKDRRLTEISKDPYYMYNARISTYKKLNPTTQLTYNAFGELTTRSVKLNDIDWATTTHKYNTDGLKTATLDAEHYLTTYNYNTERLLAEETQYAARTLDINVLPVTSSTDRVVSFVYNAVGQLTQKTLKNVSYQRLTGKGAQYETLTRDLTSKYAYDAMGHMISTTDPEGHTAYSYYNAQGQLTTKIGVAMPSGRAATTYQYDALGQLVESHKWANGAQIADETQFRLNNASQADIIAYDIYDQSGHITQKIDGTGHVTQYSYDANGNIARSWQVLNQANASSLIIDKRYAYDQENRLTQTATIKSTGQWVTEDARYNVFGDVIKKGMNGKFVTQIDYNQAGHVWRSNTQGYFQIYVYDLSDNVTQVLTSTNLGDGRYSTEEGIDLSDSCYDFYITYDKGDERYTLQHQNNVYDALGRLVQQTHEARFNYIDNRNDTDDTVLPVITQLNEVDRWGNLLQHTNANGYITRYQYNAMNALTQQTLPEVNVVDEHGIARLLAPTLYYAVDGLGRTIAMTDANGHSAAHVFDAEGHITQDIDARDFHRDKKYNLFGQLTSQTNERGGLTTYTYDQENRLLTVSTTQTTQGYQYNGAGQVIHQTSNQGSAQTLVYDELGHITEQITPRGTTVSEWDDDGHKIAEHDALGHTATWMYDDFGRVREHTDLGGHRTQYTYNKNGLIIKETSTSGKDIHYLYYNDGQLLEYSDITRLEIITFTYDARGNVTSRVTSRAGEWKPESDLYQYDALDRLEHVMRRSPEDFNPGIPTPDHRLLSIDYEYDAVGNIRDSHVTANYTGYQATSHTDYFRYDENNRMTLNKGQLINGEISITKDQGSAMGYDEAGNISSALKYEGGILQSFSYYYNLDNLLEITRKNNKDLHTKRYENGLLIDETLYDNNGMATQFNITIYKDGQIQGQVIRARYLQVMSQTAYTYDAVGNVTKLITKGPHYTVTHDYDYELWDNYQQKTDNVTQAMDGAATSYGKSTYNYDVNGLLQNVIDYQPGINNNTTTYYSSNLDGVRTRKDKTGKTSYLTVAGKTIGDLHLDNYDVQKLEVYGGFTPEGVAAQSTRDQLIRGKRLKGQTLRDFLQQTQIEAVMPDSVQDNLGAYTLKSGDTLESIAFQIYGDSSLWYLLADANGITDRAALAGEQNSQLVIGRRINIPPSTKGQHHTSQTHKVLSTGYVTGDTSATAYSLVVQPPQHPSNKDKFQHLFATIVVAVTTAVVMVLGAGALGAMIGASGGLVSIGLAVLGGSSGVGLSATLGISFAAGFISSIAGQGMANLLGQQKGIDFKGALITGLGTAATAGVSNVLTGSNQALQQTLQKSPLNDYFSISSAAEMMERDAVSQSLNLALTRHQHFNWLELGVSSATAGLMGGGKVQAVNNALNEKIGTANTFVNSELQALATGSLTNSHFDAAQILTDNLGNALGSTIIQAANKQPDYSPIPEAVEEDTPFCPIPAEENVTPIPEGTYERLNQEAALRRRLEEASAKYGSGSDGALLNSGSVFGIIGDAVYGDGGALSVGQGALKMRDDITSKPGLSFGAGDLISGKYDIDYAALVVNNPGKAYRNDQIIPDSNYNKSPGSPIYGDASIELQTKAIDALIASSIEHHLSARDTAHVLAIARHESGFNPFAAAGSTTASGLGQFVNGTGLEYGINSSNRWSLNIQSDALVEHYLENKARIIQKNLPEAYIYKFHHDGPYSSSRHLEGLRLSNKHIIPQIGGIQNVIQKLF